MQVATPSRRVVTAALLAGLALVLPLLPACGGGSQQSGGGGGTAINGGTATWALPPSSLANYILPLEPIADATPQNVQWMQYLFYRPLYSFGAGASYTGSDNAAGLNEPLSLAKQPAYSNGDKTVTITLKSYKWSDGTPVTARDVQFWQNMVTANKDNWFSYVPGAYPDNVTATKVIDQHTIQFTLDKGYGPLWFTYNELSQITPLPQHVMDKTSTSGPVGNYDMTPAGARAVYAFLSAQAKDEKTYTTNPLWQVIDGPWRLVGFNGTTGRSVYKYNTKYSGPVPKHHITTFIEEPFTTDAAEYNVLRSGNLDYGYIPSNNASLHSQLTHYNFAPWLVMIINFANVNQNNPTVGPIFRQVYIRQAMQELFDQVGIIKSFYAGYAVPTCGPVPAVPNNPWASSYEKSCPFKYNPSAAVKLLRSHGWTVVPGGVSFCSDPSKCGPGIPKGAKLEFDFEYATGRADFVNSVQTMKSDAEKAGIRYDLRGAPFGTVVSDSTPCGPGSSTPNANCNWQITYWGGWGYQPDYYPTGELLFATGAGANYSNYSNPTADRYIQATQLPGNPKQAMEAYERFMVDQIPVVYGVNRDFRLSEIAKNLHGTMPQNGEANIWPELWYFTK